MNDSVRLLISQLSTLEDPRQTGKVTFPLVGDRPVKRMVQFTVAFAC